MKLRYASFILYSVLMIAACVNDSLPEPSLDGLCFEIMPTYDTNIKQIIETNCSYQSDCHGAGSPNGDYTTYENIMPNLRNGKVRERTIDLQDMPPPPEALTPETRDTLQCWIEQGFPEN